MAKEPNPWIQQALKLEKSTKKRDRHIGDYPAHLRGFATNRYGGTNLQRERGLVGNTYGAAGPVRTYTKAEIADYECRLRERGDLI